VTDEKKDEPMKKLGTIGAAVLAGAMMGGGAVALKTTAANGFTFGQFSCGRTGVCEAEFEVMQDGKGIGMKTVRFGNLANEKMGTMTEKLPPDIKACISATKSGSFLKLLP
jgi:hypothetical protein